MDDFGFGLGFDESQAQETQDLIARTDDPRVGVHTLTEFIYCPRAGLVSFEQQQEDRGEEGPAIYLDYLPQYDLIRMAATWDQLFRRLLLGAGTMVLLMFVFMLENSFLFLVLLGEIVLIFWVFRLCRDLWKLGNRIRRAEQTQAWQPDPNSTEEQTVNWWQLLNSGFESKHYIDPLLDPLWSLSGNPWRVLAYQGLRIPVFRYHQYTGKIYPQHRARMAAYCQLIERTTGMESPYGIILFGNTFQGVSIPNSPPNQQLFQQALIAFRTMLRKLKTDRLVPGPPPPTLCLRCPVGKPIVFRKGHTETYQLQKPLPVTKAKGRGPLLYHSPCGDRFKWLPPHEIAIAKKLKQK